MVPHVGIIGAGVSGLRCATVLIEQGFDVTIIEARNRIGGRIAQSDQMGPLEVDIGANWVHRYAQESDKAGLPVDKASTGYNPIIEIAKQTETPVHRWEDSLLLIDHDGSMVAPAEASKALKQVWEILEEAIQHSTNSSAKIDSAASLYGFFQDRCSRAFECGEMTGREAELVLSMSQMWGAYVGDRIEVQSLQYFYLEDCIDGGSYRKILAHISETPLAKAHVHIDTIMTSVEYRTGDHAPVCVTNAGGKEQFFDEVVVTTPLGWLKRNKRSLPGLHPRIASAIESISFGRLEKVLIEFPTAFWDTVAADAGGDAERPVSFVHWLSPSYATQTNPHKWRLECVSFHAFSEPYRRNILLFYTFGDCSNYITSSISGLRDEVRDRWLRHFFEPYYSRLPGYQQDRAPLRFLATEWCNDEFAGNGSYSNFQIGMLDAAHDVEAIRHGMPEQHIYFAGEHTAPFDGLGTVAGAYTSGEMVARRIIQARRYAEATKNRGTPDEL